MPGVIFSRRLQSQNKRATISLASVARNKDYLPQLNAEQKKDQLARISYTHFLTELAGMHPDVVRLYQSVSQPLFGVGIEAIAALDASDAGYPGFRGMGLEPEGLDQRTEITSSISPTGMPSIARLLIRRLIP